MAEELDKRKAAKKRLKAQSEFKKLFGVFIIIWIIVTAIWWLSGGGYFWPAWTYLGMGIALLFTGWGAYGPRSAGVSDAAIDREMKKMDE